MPRRKTGSVMRELRWCGGFGCKTIHFIPSSGPAWAVDPVSQCWLYGPLDNMGQFTGDNIAWVFPDNTTALIGKIGIHHIFLVIRAGEASLKKS